jgi:hypothetical protein
MGFGISNIEFQICTDVIKVRGPIGNIVSMKINGCDRWPVKG